MTRIYLAHSGKEDIRKKVKEIQNILEEYTNIFVVNPFDSGAESKALTHLWDEHPKCRDSELCEAIVKKDLQNIEDCDILIAYIEEPSFGTSMEIFFSSKVLGRKIYIITECESPWLEVHGIIVKNIEQLLEVLELK